MAEWITGRNPVFEVIRAGRRRLNRLRFLEGAEMKGRLLEILKLCHEAGIEVEPVSRRRLDQISLNHQGVALSAEAYPYSTMTEILDGLAAQARAGIVLLLDEVQDPQNLGTLLRTAEAVGVRGVFMPSHRAASVTPSVVQASAGATEDLSIAQANLVDVIGRLKQEDYWVIGLENSPDASPPDTVRLDGRIALTVGSESQGMRRLVRDSCDWIMRLPIQGEIGSLNAAVAGSIALFLAWTAQRRADFS